jgi:hypothetical protein
LTPCFCRWTFYFSPWQTTGFRRLGCENILATEAGILHPFFEASETGSWRTMPGGKNGGVQTRQFQSYGAFQRTIALPSSVK